MPKSRRQSLAAIMSDTGRERIGDVKGAENIGFFNATHTHGEPNRNLIQALKARRNRANGLATHNPAMDIQGIAQPRAGAPMGQMPAWVARQMAAGKGGMSGGGRNPIPPNVTPTKPPEQVAPPTMYPQGSDAIVYPQSPPRGPAPVYPLRRPQSVARPGEINNRKR